MTLPPMVRKLGGKALRALVARMSFPLYPWVLWWEATRRCNLECSYCTTRVAACDATQENPDRAVAAILKYRPKYLEILGGEPLLVKGLPDYLAAIKTQADNPVIMLSTNLTCEPETVEALFPWIDHLFVSLDARGDLNRQLRGLDGEVILDRLRMVSNARQRHPRTPQIHVATVITTANYRGIDDLVKALNAVDSSIEMVFIPIEPYDHPLSIMQDRDAVTAFLATVNHLKHSQSIQLTTRFPRPGPITDQLQIAANSLADQRPFRCCRQFFRLVIDAQGNEVRCRPDRALALCAAEIQKATSVRQQFQLITQLLGDLTVRRAAPICRAPCSATEFLSALIEARAHDSIPRELCMFQGKFSQAEVAEIARFIRKRLNPQWNQAIERALRAEGDGCES